LGARGGLGQAVDALLTRTGPRPTVRQLLWELGLEDLGPDAVARFWAGPPAPAPPGTGSALTVVNPPGAPAPPAGGWGVMRRVAAWAAGGRPARLPAVVTVAGAAGGRALAAVGGDRLAGVAAAVGRRAAGALARAAQGATRAAAAALRAAAGGWGAAVGRRRRAAWGALRERAAAVAAWWRRAGRDEYPWGRGPPTGDEAVEAAYCALLRRWLRRAPPPWSRCSLRDRFVDKARPTPMPPPPPPPHHVPFHPLCHIMPPLTPALPASPSPPTLAAPTRWRAW
jgi:hypothetical protein